MYCSHPGCKSSKLIFEPQINSSYVLINVQITSLHYYHNPDYALKNHVRGIEKNLVRGTLKNTKVFTYDLVKSASPSKQARGNNQKVKSVDVLRRIRSEAISADDYDKDDMVDMLLMYSENCNYIKHVGLPSYVHCYRDEQLNLLTKLKSKCKRNDNWLFGFYCFCSKKSQRRQRKSTVLCCSSERSTTGEMQQ